MSSWTSCDAAGWHGDGASDDEEVIVLKPSSRLPDPVWPSSSLSSANGSVSSSNSMNGFINNPTRKVSSSRSLSTSASGDVDALANSLENTRLGGAAVRPLIVLDLNGLVVRRVKKQQITQAQLAQLNRPGGPYPAGKLYYAWKRPFAEDFIKFLAAKFDVVIWSSARRDNINHMLRVVLTNSKRNSILSPKEQESILGIMDQSDCVVAAQWPDDPDRPLFIKELERVWKNFPQHGPQDTLLVDDSLYKAARNPANTAIHPKDWRIGDLTDKSLAPGGNMRGYLENLANAAQSPDFKGVPAFVAANPFDSGRTDEENKEELYFDEWVRKALDGSS